MAKKGGDKKDAPLLALVIATKTDFAVTGDVALIGDLQAIVKARLPL